MTETERNQIKGSLLKCAEEAEDKELIDLLFSDKDRKEIAGI